MRKIESIFIMVSLIAVIAVSGGAIWHHTHQSGQGDAFEIPTTKYGAYLAAQHAVYVNDFDSAQNMAAHLQDVDYPMVKNTVYIADFLSGKMPLDAHLLKKEKGMPAQLVYDAHLVLNDQWQELYNRHKTDSSALGAPLRIWPAVANKQKNSALKFIEKLPTHDSWKAFIIGQIYAESNEPDKAAEYFAKVKTDFMNINDFMYVMSFYKHHNMQNKADILRADFTSRPGGMFMLDYPDVPDWSVYQGYKNQLAFSLVQNVSHTQIMMYSDLAMLLLQFAHITAPDFAQNNNAIDYYLGNFFYTNNGDWQKHFAKISPESPFYLFGVLRNAEKTGDIEQLDKELKKHPLFVPAVNKLIAHHIKNGNKRAALRVADRAINNKNLDENGRAFFIKSRAQIHFAFGDLKSAQQDLHDAATVLITDPEIFGLQAKIWAKQNRELENAYHYASTLVRQNPADILAWDTMGCVVAAREGADAALDVLKRVGEVAETCSALFEHIGDMYIKTGKKDEAIEAYRRAIELADDGLVVVPYIERKIRKIK